jgi:hypothetical protein
MGKFLLVCDGAKTALSFPSPRICAAIASPNTVGFPMQSLSRGLLQATSNPPCEQTGISFYIPIVDEFIQRKEQDSLIFCTFVHL